MICDIIPATVIFIMYNHRHSQLYGVMVIVMIIIMVIVMIIIMLIVMIIIMVIVMIFIMVIGMIIIVRMKYWYQMWIALKIL